MNTPPKPLAPQVASAPKARIVLKSRFRFYVLLVLAVVPTISIGQTRNSNTNADPAVSQQSRKRIATWRRSEATEGSRLTISSDSTLEDYKISFEGDRFVVLVPGSALLNAGTIQAGSGFSDLRIEQLGDDVALSFKLRDGATVNFSQTFNRVDVIFFTNGQVNKSRVQDLS